MAKTKNRDSIITLVAVPPAQTDGDDDEQLLLEHARKDSDYAKLLCSHVANVLELRQPLADHLRRFLIEALRAISDGEDPRRAFRISQSGRPGNLHRDVAIAVDYWKLRSSNTKKAEMRVAEAWNLAPGRVKKIAIKFKDESRRRIALEKVFQRLHDEETNPRLRALRAEAQLGFVRNREKILADHLRKTKKGH